MKIIQNNYELYNTLEEEYICEECNSVFEYNDYDVYVDSETYNEYVICPCCNHKCIVSIPTTEDNIEFPKSFYKFGEKEGAVKISDKEITSKIKDCIIWLKNNPKEQFRYIGTGDTFLCVFNHEDEYYIMVAKDYFDSYIDK